MDDKAPIRVLVVDDYEPWRRFFSMTLQRQPELQVISEASDGLEAVEKAQQLQPGLILLDIGLPKVNGIQAAREIRKVCPASKILFVSENRLRDIAEQALNTGAAGYVVKSDAGTELLAAIEAVLEGKRFVSASLSLQALRNENNPYLKFARNPSIPEFLRSVIDATAADFGTVQLFDSTNRFLRIVAQHGFESEFLDYFDKVSYDDECSCSRAMIGRCRVVVANVSTDPFLSKDAKGVLLRANVGSVQSTPLIDSSGNLLGMVSTHYRRCEGPMPHMWNRVDELAAGFVAKINP